MKVSDLNKIHHELDIEYLKDIDIFYTGWSVLKKNKQKYLPIQPNEQKDFYESRLSSASYHPYMSEIIKGLVSEVFSNNVSISCETNTFYTDLGLDLDEADTSIHELLEEVLTDALLYKTSRVIVDAPLKNSNIVSRAQELEAGTDKITVRRIPYDSLINWRKDDKQNYKLAVIKQAAIAADEDIDFNKVKDKYSVWRERDRQVTCEVYETKAYDSSKSGTFPKPDDDLILVSAVTTGFSYVPIIELELKSALWLGDKLLPMIQDFFRSRTILSSARSRNGQPIPVLQTGSETGTDIKPVSEVQSDEDRIHLAKRNHANKEMVIIGADDKLTYLTPPADSFDSHEQSLKDLINEIHRISWSSANSVSATSSALGRSGESKNLDRSMTKIIIASLSTAVKNFAYELIEFIKTSRNEDDEVKISGLITSVEMDLAQLVNLLVAPIEIRSETYKRAAEMMWVNMVLGKSVSNEVLDQINQEIESAKEVHDVTDSTVDSEV